MVEDEYFPGDVIGTISSLLSDKVEAYLAEPFGDRRMDGSSYESYMRDCCFEAAVYTMLQLYDTYSSSIQGMTLVVAAKDPSSPFLDTTWQRHVAVVIKSTKGRYYYATHHYDFESRNGLLEWGSALALDDEHGILDQLCITYGGMWPTGQDIESDLQKFPHNLGDRSFAKKTLGNITVFTVPVVERFRDGTVDLNTRQERFGK